MIRCTPFTSVRYYKARNISVIYCGYSPFLIFGAPIRFGNSFQVPYNNCFIYQLVFFKKRVTILVFFENIRFVKCWWFTQLMKGWVFFFFEMNIVIHSRAGKKTINPVFWPKIHEREYPTVWLIYLKTHI